MDPADAAGPAPLRIEVVYSPAPRQVRVVALTLPAGSTLADALQASGLIDPQALEGAGLRCGVWGRMQPGDHRLRDGDRVEVYRPLTVDPKEARRLRYKRHRQQTGEKGA